MNHNRKFLLVGAKSITVMRCKILDEFNKAFILLVKFVCKDLLLHLAQGAATTCYVALHPEEEGTTGKYFQDCSIATPSSEAQDELLARKLWDFSEFNKVLWPWIIDLATLRETIIFVGFFFKRTICCLRISLSSPNIF